MSTAKPTNEIYQPATPRTTVEVHLPEGRVLCGPRNRPIASFFKALPEWNARDPIVGAVVNGELRELTYPVEIDARARPVKMSEPDGSGIYRRSVTFLLEAAFEDVFPDADIAVEHSLSSGGFYCSVFIRLPWRAARPVRLAIRAAKPPSGSCSRRRFWTATSPA